MILDNDSDVEETEEQEPEEDLSESERLEEERRKVSAKSRAELLSATGAAGLSLYGYEEAPTEEQISEELKKAQDENLAKRQAVRDETEELERLDVKGLLQTVETSRELLGRGEAPLQDASTPNIAIRSHARNLGMTPEEYREAATKFGIGIDGMVREVAYAGKTANKSLEIAEKHNPLIRSEADRESARRALKKEEKYIQQLQSRGVELPSYLLEDSFLFDDETSSFFGTDPSEVEGVAIEGDTSYNTALLRSQALMSDPKVARYIREFDYQQLGGEQYYDNRLEDLLTEWREENPNHTSDSLSTAHARFGKQIMAELASLKTVGLWTMPIFLRRERIEQTTYDYGIKDMSWLEAFSPRIEVIGIHRRGGGRTFVLRQAGALDTLFRVLDSPKSAVVGRLKYGEGGGKLGIAEGAQALDYAGQLATQNDWNTIQTTGAMTVGAIADVISPDTLVALGIVRKLTGGSVRAVRLSREIKGFTKDAERLLDAVKKGDSAEFSAIESQMAVRYPNLIDRVDSNQASMTDLLVKGNPDIKDTSLADVLPGEAGRLEINLAPEIRRTRTRIPGGEGEEAISQPLYTRGNNSTIDDFNYQEQVVLRELEKLKKDPTFASQYAPQLMRRSAEARDEITKILVQIGDVGDSTLVAKKIEDSLAAALETPVRGVSGPSVWSKSIDDFIDKSIPSIAKDGRRAADENFDDFVKRIADQVSAEEIVALRKKHDARKNIKIKVAEIRDEAKRLRQRLYKEGTSPEQLRKQTEDLLNRALAAVQTNKQARIASIYIVYQEAHAMASVLKKPMRLGKMRKDLIDSTLFDDLQDFMELSPEASSFSNEARVVLKNIDRRQSLMLARLLDSRAKTWAARHDRTVSEWWTLNFGSIRSRSDMRKAIRGKMGGDPNDTPPVIDDIPKADEVDPGVSSDINDYPDAPPYSDPPPPTIPAPTPRKLKGQAFPEFKEGKGSGYRVIGGKAERSDSPQYLYDNLAQFDARLNPDATGRDVLNWMSKHCKHPAARVLANRLKDVVPKNSKFYIQNAGGSQNPLGFVEGRSPFERVSNSYGHCEYTSDVTLNRVVVMGSGSSVTGLTDSTIIHEFIHSATAELIRKPPNAKARQAVDELNDLGDQVFDFAASEVERLAKKGKAKSGSKQSDVWIKSLSDEEAQTYEIASYITQSGVLGKEPRGVELIAHALTGSAVQNFLRKVPVKGTKAVDSQNGFTKFVDQIAKLISFVGKAFSKAETNALRRVIIASDELLSVTEEAVATAKATTKGLSQSNIPLLSMRLDSAFLQLDLKLDRIELTVPMEQAFSDPFNIFETLNSFSGQFREIRKKLSSDVEDWGRASIRERLSGPAPVGTYSSSDYKTFALTRMDMLSDIQKELRNKTVKFKVGKDESAEMPLAQAIRENTNPDAVKAFDDFLEELDRFSSSIESVRNDIIEGLVDVPGTGFSRQVSLQDNPARLGRTDRSAVPTPVTKADIDTPEFKSWFGDSKVVDDAGDPLVVYHGSRRSRGFEAFDPTKRGSAIDAGFLGEGFYFSTKPDTAAYYAGVGRAPRNMDEIVEASGFVPVGREGSIIPAYLSLKNPYDFGTKTQGVRGLVMRGDRLPDDIHDAVVARAGFEFDPDLAKADYSASVTQPLERDLSRAMREVLIERGYDGVVSRVGDELELVAFEPPQIKSIYNRGTFDPSDVRVQRSAVPTPPTPTPSAADAPLLIDIQDGRAVLSAFDDEGAFVDLVGQIGQVLRRDMDPSDLDELAIYLKGPPYNLDIEVKGALIVGPDAAKAERVFAQSFERYILGGSKNAPTRGMRSVFSHSKNFLGRIYASIRGDVDIAIDPKLKTFLDRMLMETPSTGKMGDLRRAFVNNLRGVAGDTARMGKFHGLRQIISDKPVGVNADLGSVSVSARISEDLRRMATEQNAKGSLLSETEIMKKIDDLIEQVSTSNGNIRGSDIRLDLDIPILQRIYGPDGKKSFTLDELVSLQSRLEAERAEALTTAIPGPFTRTANEAVKELTPVDELRNFADSKAMTRAVVFTFFGGDPAAIGRKGLRDVPSMVRSEMNGAGKLIEEAYGNIIRLIKEGDAERVSAFLSGKLVTFKFGGRQAFSSGYDCFGAVSRQLRVAIDDISIQYQGVKFEGDRLLEQLERFFGHVDPTKKPFYAHNLPTTSAEQKLAGAVGNDFIRMLFAGMNPKNSTSFTRDVGQALNITMEAPTSQQIAFAESLLYYTGFLKRNKTSIYDTADLSSMNPKQRQAFQQKTVTSFLDETETAFGKSEEAVKNKNRVAVLMAGHGQVERVIQNMHARGLAFEEVDYNNFKKWINGEYVTPSETVGVMRLMRKLGMNPRLAQDPLLQAGVFLPEVARKRISEALARGLDPGTGKVGFNVVSEQDMAGIIGGAIRYMKLRMTRGAVALRQRYFLMNTIDHFSQMAMVAGFRVATVSTIRVAAQDVMVIPFVARTLALVDKGSPGAMEKFREVLQKGGDSTARAVGKLLRVSVYRADLNDILNGREGYVRLGKKVYSNREIRDIMVEEGIFASFDTRALADVIRTDVTKLKGGMVRDAEDILLGTVTDVAEAWSERERAGAVLSLIESGLSPRAAARVTIDALYDYAGTMSKLDRSWWMSLLFPFWAFQKNANAQVFNLAFSPAGAYRMGCIRRATTTGPEYFNQLLMVQLSESEEYNVPTPYGVYLADMTQTQRDLYYTIVKRLEFGYGPIDQMDTNTRNLVLSSYAVSSFDELSDRQISLIENGYGPSYTMPEEVRESITSMFLGTADSRVIDGVYLESEGGIDDLLSQTGLISGMYGDRYSYRSRSRYDDFISMTRKFTIDEMGDNEIRAFMKNRGRFPIPPVLNEQTREFYETLRFLSGERGTTESPYLELLLPDSTINAGFRHISNLTATYALLGHSVLAPGMNILGEAIETPTDLSDFKVEQDPLTLGLSPLTPFREVLKIEDTPIPGPLLEALTDQRIGYPRRVHPLLGELVENVMPGVSVLKIDPKEAEQEDPFLQAESMTFATQEEYDAYIASGNQDLTLMRERVYLPPGFFRFLFDNSPLGEANRILMTMPTKVPFTNVGFSADKAERLDYRSQFERFQDPEQLIQWSRFLLGVDVKETAGARTARIEERKIPKELK